MQNIQRESE